MNSVPLQNMTDHFVLDMHKGPGKVVIIEGIYVDIIQEYSGYHRRDMCLSYKGYYVVSYGIYSGYKTKNILSGYNTGNM